MSPFASAALALAVCFGSPLLAAAQPEVAATEVNPSGTPAATPAPAPGTPQTTETEILATLGATFNSKDRIAVFTGDVRVTDPRFQLSCDKLTVYLNKSASTGGALGGDAATPAPATPPPLAAAPGAAPSPTPQSGGGIDHAIAEGHVIIVQQRAATAGGEAKRSVGRGDWGMFDNKSGDMVLKGTPSVEQNENTHVATSPNTVMTMRKDNSLTTIGPSRTVIVQRKTEELPGAGGGSPAPGASPAAGHKHGHQPPAATPAA